MGRDKAYLEFEGETLIEEIEAELKAAMPQLDSIYIRPEKQRDAVRVAPS